MQDLHAEDLHANQYSLTIIVAYVEEVDKAPWKDVSKFIVTNIRLIANIPGMDHTVWYISLTKYDVWSPSWLGNLFDLN